MPDGTWVTGLAEKTRHDFGFFVKDSTGNWSTGSTTSDSTLDGTPPQFISGLTATPVSGTQVDLDWAPVSDADAELIRFGDGLLHAYHDGEFTEENLYHPLFNLEAMDVEFIQRAPRSVAATNAFGSREVSKTMSART